MEAVIALAALALSAIAAILFYKIVERRHKILLAKLTLAVAGVGVLVLLAVYAVRGHDARDAEERRRTVAIRYVPPAPPKAQNATNPELRFLGFAYDTVTFELCNQGRDTVTQVDFFPETYVAGHSTVYPLVALYIAGVDLSGVSNTLRSDLILPPGMCGTMTWVDGPYHVRDTVIARPLTVRVRD